MIYKKFNYLFLTILIPILIFQISNCAVLSESQIKEVQKFSNASEQYTTLPGALTESCGILLRNNKLLSVSRKKFGAVDKNGGVDTRAAIRAWEDIEQAYKLETDLKLAGKKMNAAIGVIKVYSIILTLLVSDKYSESLSDAAAETGISLDNAIMAYNAKFSTDKPLDPIGGTIAILIRGAAGIYLRQKQYSILRDTIEEADPLVGDIMERIAHIANNLFKPVFENYEKNYLAKEFKSVANNQKKLSVTTISFVYEDLVRTKNAITLSNQVAQAAIAYRNAHSALVENTRSRMDLDSIIKEVEALIKEVAEARMIKEKVAN